jgi:hypothetical protein
MHTRGFTVALATCVVVVLAACSPAAAPAPTVTGGTTAIDDLTIDACPPGSGRLTSTGSLRNSGDAAADFVVRVSWLDADAKVMETVWQSIEGLDADESADWSVSVDLGDATASSCTAAVTRGSL